MINQDWRDVETSKERATRRLIDAAHAALHVTIHGGVLTDSDLRTIGNSYGSICFSLGPVEHPKTVKELRSAMDRFADEFPETDELLFPEIPF